MKGMVHKMLLVAGASLLAAGAVAGQPEIPAKPADIDIDVAPGTVAPGGQVEVTVTLDPIEGVKINRYPKIKLEVPAREGLVLANQAAMGSSTPPPPEKLLENYFEQVDPLKLTLTLDESAPAGRHELDGKLTYNYCVPAKGFCVPARVPVKIPVTVR